MHKVIVYLFYYMYYFFLRSTEDKRNGAKRLEAHKKNCKKGKDRYGGHTVYFLGKTLYNQGFTSRTTTSATRCATSEDRVKAKKIAAAEKPKALKTTRKEKPKALPKGLINKIGKHKDLLQLYISEESRFEKRMTKHLTGKLNNEKRVEYKEWIAQLQVLEAQSETMTSADSNMSQEECRAWCLKALESTGKFSVFRDEISKALIAAEDLHSDGESAAEPVAAAEPAAAAEPKPVLLGE